MANLHEIRDIEEEPFTLANNRVIHIEEEPFKTANLRVIRDIVEESSDEEMEESNPSRLVSSTHIEVQPAVGPKRFQGPNLGYKAKAAQTRKTSKGSEPGVVEVVGKGLVVETETEESITDEISAHLAASKMDDGTQITSLP